MTSQETHQSIHQGTILRDKFTTEDVFERIIQVASEEVTTGHRELFFSALAAGFSITLTFLLYASLTAKSGGNVFLGSLLYPLGFVFIVLGGYQLFTENTLPPVALVAERMSSLPRLLYVWFVVLAGNIFGGFLGAFTLAKTGIFTSKVAETAIGISIKAATVPFDSLFFRGMMAGLIVAGVVWLDYAMRDGVVRFFIVYLSFLSIPLAGLNHIVITATEMFFLSFSNGTPLLGLMIHTALPVLLGNIAGGVILVTIVNYFQTPGFVKSGPKQRLAWRDWFFSMKTYRRETGKLE